MQTLSSSEARGSPSECAPCARSLAASQNPQPGNLSRSPLGKAADSGSFRILAVDDIALNRLVLRRACQLLGYECDIV